MTRYTCLISGGDGPGKGLCFPVGHVMQQIAVTSIGDYECDHVKKVNGCAFLNSHDPKPLAPLYDAKGKIKAGAFAKSRRDDVRLAVEGFARVMTKGVTVARLKLPTERIGVFPEPWPLAPGNGVAYGGTPGVNDGDHERLVRMGVNGGADFVFVQAYLHQDFAPWMTAKQAADFVLGTIRQAQAFGPIVVGLVAVWDGSSTWIPRDTFRATLDACEAAGVSACLYNGVTKAADVERFAGYLS